MQRARTGCISVCHLHGQLVPVSWVEHLTSGGCWREPDRWCIPGRRRFHRDTNVRLVMSAFKLKIINPLDFLLIGFLTIPTAHLQRLQKSSNGSWRRNEMRKVPISPAASKLPLSACDMWRKTRVCSSVSEDSHCNK